MLALLATAATPTPTVDTVFGQTFGAGCVAVFLINWLKNASWFPLLQKDWKTAQRLWSIVLAAASAAGVHVVFAAGTLSISGLTLTGILTAGWAWIKAFSMQEFVYQATKQQAAANAKAQAPQQVVELAEAAPRPTPAAKPSDEVKRSDVDEFVRKVRGPLRRGFGFLFS